MARATPGRAAGLTISVYVTCHGQGICSVSSGIPIRPTGQSLSSAELWPAVNKETQVNGVKFHVMLFMPATHSIPDSSTKKGQRGKLFSMYRCMCRKVHRVQNYSGRMLQRRFVGCKRKLKRLKFLCNRRSKEPGEYMLISYLWTCRIWVMYDVDSS